jgi:Zn-dependent M28 family amino/carboxypeptidase
VPGTPAHARCRDLLLATLRPLADRVDVETFRVEHPRFPGGLALTNVVARFGLERFPRGDRPIALVAHWDSRPWCDASPEAKHHTIPVPGANDGASGVSVLLELARLFRAAPPPLGVDLVFVDGEDLGTDDYMAGYCLGSRRYVSGLGDDPPFAAIVLDMVGDADLSIPVEIQSRRSAPWLIERIWSAARRAGQGRVFDPTEGPAVYDDHVPFIAAGIPAVDLIDFDYPPWHTPGDDLSKVSAASLHAVGACMVELLYGGSLP